MKDWARPFYKSSAWRYEVRPAYLASVFGLCERCLKLGKEVPAKIVHHKKYITRANINDPMITLDFKNLEALCQDCHNKEHGYKKRFKRDDVMFDEHGNLVSK